MQNPKPEAIFDRLLAMQADNQAKLPPVEKWSPALSGDMDLRIARDGTWYHEGDPIRREAIVKLFATILVREGDDYFLVTPVEKWRIQVDDAPFLVVDVDVENPGSQQALVLTTNVGERLVVGEANPLWVEQDKASSEPAPYVCVRKNLNALINRNVFYRLADMVVERSESEDGETGFGVWSLGRFFSLG